jgi:hypothetical protein
MKILLLMILMTSIVLAARYGSPARATQRRITR